MYQNLRPLTDALARKALELNENDEKRTAELNALRIWVQAQPYLRSRTSDQFLIVFLRSAKFNLERAKHKLKNFYLYRSRMPEIFSDRNVHDPKVYEILKAGCLVHLPEPIAPDGPRVVMVRPNCFDLSKYTIPEIFKVGTMAADILLYEDDNAIVAGYVVIMDLAHISKTVLFKFDPKFVRKLTILINKIMPTRMKGFHFLHVPPIFELLFNMVKGVINTKLRDRFYVYGSNYEKLYDHLPRHILPQQYGGQCDITRLQKLWWHKIHDNEPFFREEEQFGIANCSKSKKLKNVCASLKKLNID